jgi:sulfide:quinone oxidoreductase
MAHAVIVGAGLGGTPMAYEIKALLRKQDKVTAAGHSRSTRKRLPSARSTVS